MPQMTLNKLLLTTALVSGLITTASAEQMNLALSGKDSPAQRSRAFFPLGVYWPGEFLFRDEQKQLDWKRNEAILDSLAAHHCNTVWLTHVSARDAAEFARRAAKRGIYLVASLAELAGEVPHIRKADHAKQIAGIRAAWGDAPAPIAWGLGDEPRTAYMHEMTPFVKAWADAGEPVTTVVMAGELPAAGALLNLQNLCADIYPFFGFGCPNGPDNIAESSAYVTEAGQRAQFWSRKNGIDWWFMGGIFQEPWGNRGYDAKGNIIYGVGAGPNFRMPTPAEVRWQNWAALAAGARGLIHFSLIFAPGKAGPPPEPMPENKCLSWGFKETTNSNSPGGILYPDGRPTPQYEAMGESFAAVAKITPVLKRAAPLAPADAERIAFHSKGWIPPGDVVRVFRAASRRPEYYVLVVNGGVQDKERRKVPVNLGPDVTGATDMRTGQKLELFSKSSLAWEPVFPPFHQVRVALPPGDGTLLRLELGGETGLPPQQRASFLPLGVYWAGEYSWPGLPPAERWARIEESLADLQAHHVNAVWLTHLDAATTAEFARRAERRGIYVVASIATLAGEVPHIRKGNHKQLIAETLAAWGDAPAPIAWGLGDEPLAAYAREMVAYAHAWRKHAPGEPLTTVVMWGDVAAYGALGFDALCCDIYPFFSAGNPNGYAMPANQTISSIVGNLAARPPRAWFMGQAYQEIWGPYKLNDKGNLVMLPGSAGQWDMPSPAAMRWQVWAAIASGAHGAFFFHYIAPAQESPKAGPSNLPNKVAKTCDTGSPRTLVYPDGRTTPQYEALSLGFAEVAPHARTITRLRPSPGAELSILPGPDGKTVPHMARVLVSADGKERWAVIVSHFGAAPNGKWTVRVALGPHLSGLCPPESETPLDTAPLDRLSVVTLELEPGEGRLLRCLPAADSAIYADDFRDDRFTRDALKVNGVRRYETASGSCISATGHQQFDQAWVLYDVEKLLGAGAGAGESLLIYNSTAVPPTFRGARWQVSNDTKTWRNLSLNESGKAVTFRGRYLRVGLSWNQSSSAAHYGSLRDFTLIRVPPSAVERARQVRLGGRHRPDLPVEKLKDGRRVVRYQVDLQRAGLPKADGDLIGSTFQNWPNAGDKYRNGIYGRELRLLFDFPGEVESIRATGNFANFAHAVPREYSIFYSVDGKKYRPLVKLKKGAGADHRVEGEVRAQGGPRRLWVSYRLPESNSLIVLKKLSLTVTLKAPTPDREN